MLASLTQATLFIWPALVLFIFERQAVQRAIVTSYVGAWLFLPPIRIDLQGIPDWSKATATSFAVLAALLLKNPQPLLSFRPRWFDLPILAFCWCSLASALATGMGSYEGFSSVLEESVLWGLPYLIGRIYLGDRSGAHQLALGIAVGGLLYAPLCLLEIRLSPILKIWVYGIAEAGHGLFDMRYGGYRPSVFLTTGLEVGWWMCCATLCATLLVSSRATRQFLNLPAIPLAWILGLVTLACKATGALVQLSVGVALILLCRLSKKPILFWVLLLIAPAYCLSRSSGYCSGQSIGSMASQVFAAERIQSLEYRFLMEDRLIDVAWQHPLLGWTRSGGFNPVDEQGRPMAVTDGYWIIVFCCSGYVGLTLLNLMLLLPSGLFLRRFPVSTWLSPAVAPVLALATILPLFMIDNLSNAMLNPIYAIAMGVVGSCCDRGRASILGSIASAAEATDDHPSQEAADLRAAIAHQSQLVHRRPQARHVSDLALLRSHYARLLADQGDRDQASTERSAAEALWQSADRPTGRPTWSAERLANANDLAWLLASEPAPETTSLPQARQLIEEVVRTNPTQAPFWNTLGLVCYRQADYHRAIQALSRSVTLSPTGGTAFDFYVLALANRALGYHQVAATWLDRAEAWRHAHPQSEPALAALRAEVFPGSP